MKAALDQHASGVSIPSYSDDHNNSHHHHHHNQMEQHQHETNSDSKAGGGGGGGGGYDRIKANYLRSLNIAVPTKKTDANDNDSVASSAPIPIPKGQTLSQRLENSDSEDDKLNTNTDDSDVDSEQESYLAAQQRGRRRGNTSPKGVKFIPPHELAHTSNSTAINHSLPTNYRRRNMGI